VQQGNPSRRRRSLVRAINYWSFGRVKRRRMTCIHRRRGGRDKVCKTIVLACANRKLAVSWAGCLATGQNDRFLISISQSPGFNSLSTFPASVYIYAPCVISLYRHYIYVYRCYITRAHTLRLNNII